MKKNILKLIILALIITSCGPNPEKGAPEPRTISAETLKDKIAGGWAGKMIGVTYGAPTEFKAQGKTFDDPINWIPSDVKGSLWQDDLYVQLTFLMTMDQFGIDAPAKKFQELFAKAGYELWHANVQGRKNDRACSCLYRPTNRPRSFRRLQACGIPRTPCRRVCRSLS